MPSTQTRRKRKLGKALVAARAAARLDPPYVAERLRKSLGTVSKIEHGHVRPDYPTLSLMLAVYQADDRTRQAIEVLWEDAADERYRVEPSPDMGSKYRAFLRQEAEASTERTLQQTLVPGLLQTRAYATAIHRKARGFTRTRGEIERSVASRLSRQSRLRDEDESLVLHAVVDEAAIRRVVGGKDVMAEQLRHLLEVSEMPNVTLQILDEDSGEYPVMVSAMTILEFQDPEDFDCVYLEHQGGGQWIEDEENVHTFATVFDEVAAQALSTGESGEVVRARLRELEGAG